MKEVNSIDSIDDFIKENNLALIYISLEECSVCKVLMPKVEKLLKKYDKIKSIKVDMDQTPAISGKFSVFTIPTIILFIHGEEYIRESRFISISELDTKIQRYYDIMFK